MNESEPAASVASQALSADSGSVQAADDASAPLQIDLASDTLAGDVLAQGDDAGDLGDLHAALVSLSSDTFAYLDVALDHLTASADLFDVPGIDFDDLPHDDTVA
ncbi:MAG: hypothetical protein AB7J30_17715 [Hyphomicrobium sp.]|uniref:hypothetical protein n=1 Tax=Hyphomicrobium sp. TaxID=82 RepID=UPI003D1459CA